MFMAYGLPSNVKKQSKTSGLKSHSKFPKDSPSKHQTQVAKT